MQKLTVSDARKELAELINRVSYGEERIMLERRGKEVAAIVSARDLKLLERLEDALDVAEMEELLARSDNKKPVSWEKVKKGLGL